MNANSDNARDERAATAAAVSAAELGLLVLIVVTALAVRLWSFDATGINHYDEGVYVTSAYAVAHPGEPLFPNQVRFSPPFYFGATGLALRLYDGAPDHVAIMVNVLLGTLTVAALWLVTRAWFGARAGIIAAALLAFNPSHVLLSRVALTDVAFSFWFLLAVAAVVHAVDRRDYRLAIVAGIITGLAWNTKYHGWFVLVITGAALIPALWSARRHGAWRKPAAVWSTAAITAALLYVPWAIFLRDSSADAGGYGGIIRYFATMLRGEWLGNVLRYAQQQTFIEGALSRAAPLLAVGAGLLLSARETTRAAPLALLAVLLAALALLAGQAGVTALLALAALPLLLRDFASYRARVLLCWLGLWVVAAPFYQPYARLLLPFTIALLLLSGAVLARVTSGAGGHGWRAGMAFLVAGGLLFGASRAVRREAGDPWRDTRSVADAAAQIDRLVPEAAPIYVIGEPALAWYLRRAGRSLPMDVRPVELDSIDGAAFLVAGVYADRAPRLRNRIERLSTRLTRVADIEFDPNDLRLLDDMNPARARGYRAARDTTFDFTVYSLAAEPPARAAAAATTPFPLRSAAAAVARQ